MALESGTNCKWNYERVLIITVPTTSGTGSETTGVAVFDLEEMKAKVGIASRALRPLLGLVDPLHAKHMPERVAAFSGCARYLTIPFFFSIFLTFFLSFDVFCHALESFTAVHFSERTPRPTNPIERPAYQVRHFFMRFRLWTDNAALKLPLHFQIRVVIQSPTCGHSTLSAS